MRHAKAPSHVPLGVTTIDRTSDGHAVAGVTLASGESINAPVVVNVGGPHSSIINRFAGVMDDMSTRTGLFHARRCSRRRCRSAFGSRTARPSSSDLDVGLYYRPQPGGTMLIGGTEPECDELHWVDDPDSHSDYPTVEVWRRR